jgi:farnesyl-diphosphate farnesyltransferase
MEEPAPRMFWPKAIWGKYAAKLEDFKKPAEREPAVQCLNHMILDALRHLPFCIEYMRKLRNRMVFRFCAIPQIMAIGTLAVCFNNGKLFEGVVKMRRGQTAKVFDSCDNMGDLIAWFEKFLLVLEAKINNELSKDDPNYSKLKKIVEGHKELCKEEMREWKEQYPSPPAPVLSITTDLALGTALSALVYQQYLTPSFNYMIMLIALIWLFVMKRLVF